MKTFRLFPLLTILMSVVAYKSLAYDACVDGIYYDFSGTEATVTCLSAGNTENASAYSGTITIPSTVNYKGVTYDVVSIGTAFHSCSDLVSVNIPNSVTSIGDRAFLDCIRLTSLTIPISVITIGEETFEGCTSLGSISIPNSVTTIGESAFYCCSGLTSVTIPNSVTTIGKSAFGGCSGLTSVTIPNSVTTIGESAFSRCSGLTSVTIPNSVTTIGESAFSGCSGLTSVSVAAENKVYDSRNDCNAIIETKSNILICGCKNTTIPSTVNSIGNYAFSGCTEITSVAIPSSVTSIGNYAFSGCTEITSVTIPSSVTSIGNYAFSSCSKLASITFPSGLTYIGLGAFGGTAWYMSQSDGLIYIENVAYSYKGTMPNDTSINIREGTIAITERLFSGFSNLKLVTIPSSVTSIGDYAFQNCSGLTTIDIPVGVTRIGKSVFYGCSNLTSVTIPSSVTSIDDRSFGYCRSLTSVAIPSSVTSIGKSVFYGCSSLTSVTISEGVTSIGDDAFYNCNSLTSVTIPSSIRGIGSRAFYGCSSLKSIFISDLSSWCKISFADDYSNPLYYAHSFILNGKEVKDHIIIPSDVSAIGNYAFNAYSSLTSVTIPSGVTVIGNSAFSSCSSLNSINIPSSVTSIDNFAFSLCSSLTSVTIPAGLTNIGSNAFSSCSSLTSVIIPSSVTSIGSGAFLGCNSLISVTTLMTTPIQLIGNWTFTNRENATLYVPFGCKAAYEAADYWKEFKEIIEMEDDSDTDISQMENVIYTEPTSGLAGTTIDLCVKMKNMLTPVGCSFKLTLPEGVRLQTDADGDVVYELGSRAKKMSLTMQDWGDGSYDFALTPSTATATITGNEDTFITFHVVLPDDMVAGDYKLKLTRCLIQSKTDGTTKDYILSDVVSTLTVEDYMMGDVNGDRTITPSDAIMTLYHYFSVEQTGFNTKAADVNGDGTVTPADAIETLYMYFGAGSNAARQNKQTHEPQ